ncbi:MAG: helix-turn-helix domain-containing protein [Anaerolineae bacterium]|nr:helix-turn-helix domain-containing protein [Anaerolineae bacterium]
MNSFPERLKETLVRLNKSQRDLAIELGYTPSTISNWITSRSFPSLGDLRRICLSLQVSADYLLGLETLLPNEHNHNGIRWIERIPANLPPDQLQELQTGIAFFRSVIIENLDLDELRKKKHFEEYDWISLPTTFKVAVRSGALQITAVPRDNERENRLQKLYPQLRRTLVVALPDKYDEMIIRAELVAFLGATVALPVLKGVKAVGFGPGYTVLRLAELSTSTSTQFSGTKWVPLVSSSSNNLGPLSANYIASLMQSRHFGSEALYLPYISKDSEVSEKERDFYEAILTALRNTSSIFASVNGSGRKSRARLIASRLDQFRAADYGTLGTMTGLYVNLLEKGLDNVLAGEFLGLLFDEGAKAIEEMVEESSRVFFQVDLNYISDIALEGLIWIVAAGLYKAKPISVLIKNQLVNAVVIDSEIADYLIEAEEA